MTSVPTRVVAILCTALALFTFTLPAPGDIPSPGKAVEARTGMVVCASPPAADIGVAILQQGGNAVDAAVATAFAMAVTYPVAGNIGGGGFMLVHPPAAKPTLFEYRETAPASATADMFAKGVDHLSAKAAGVPGTVRGLELAHKKFGKLPWKTVVEPAIKLAADGFPLEPWSARSLNALVAGSPDHPELQRVFGKPPPNPPPAAGEGREGGYWSAGDRLVQPDLAKTLRAIADRRSDGFYTGPVAELFETEMKASGGYITKADLAAYKANEREPIHGTYRGFDVYAPPPPSAGGIGLVEMLNVLETFDLKKHGRFSPETLHLMTETMRRAYCDRAYYLGDPAFTEIPAHLTSKDYARKLAGTIDRAKATPSMALARGIPITDSEGNNTTHFSIIDKDGFAVANTYTLENSYGCRVVVRGAGFILNNEMTDFNLRPGVTTKRGAVGTVPNQIAPGKRMLSSQTPTIVTKDGKVYLITGSPGGRTITNTVLCVVLNVLEYDMDVQAAVNAPRIHHQWFPDELKMERIKEFSEAVERLKAMGHRVSGNRSQGDAHSIQVDPATGTIRGAADHRIMGKAAGY
jgi:gamma-glutamyltranspeptidase/glutathione hydrolase